jgi:hypothetical protein
MSMAELCPTPKEGLLYNDLAFSCNYTPYVAWTSTFYHGGHSYSYPERDLKKKFRVPVGASVPCPCGCGYDLDLSEKLVCELCSEYELAYCATCGSFIPRNEVWVLDDETYCKDCYDMIMNQEKEYY